MHNAGVGWHAVCTMVRKSPAEEAAPSHATTYGVFSSTAFG
jgi:hypothetical protein